MTARETNVADAAETTLSSSLAVGSTTINVTNAAAFPAVPFYAVLEPANDSKREIVLIDGTKSDTVFTMSSAAAGRGLGATADVAHDSGVTIKMVPTSLLWTDINDRVDAADAAAAAASAAIVTDHAALTGLANDDHPHYLNAARHDARDHSGLPGIPRIARGSYAGDGAATRTFVVGFTPKLVAIYDLNTYQVFHITGTAGAAASSGIEIDGKIFHTAMDLTFDGFKVTSGDANKATSTAYDYIAFG